MGKIPKNYPEKQNIQIRAGDLLDEYMKSLRLRFVSLNHHIYVCLSICESHISYGYVHLTRHGLLSGSSPRNLSEVIRELWKCDFASKLVLEFVFRDLNRF